MIRMALLAALAALGGCAIVPPPAPGQQVVTCSRVETRSRVIETCSGPQGGYFFYHKR